MLFKLSLCINLNNTQYEEKKEEKKEVEKKINKFFHKKFIRSYLCDTSTSSPIDEQYIDNAVYAKQRTSINKKHDIIYTNNCHKNIRIYKSPCQKGIG